MASKIFLKSLIANDCNIGVGKAFVRHHGASKKRSKKIRSCLEALLVMLYLSSNSYVGCAEWLMVEFLADEYG